MDVSDAQFIGLGVAYGKLILRQLNKKDQRHDRELDFLHAAHGLGAQFVEKYCKGCSFHYGQSIQRVSFHVHTDDAKRKEFKDLAFKWQTAPLDSQDGLMSADQVVAKVLNTISSCKELDHMVESACTPHHRVRHEASQARGHHEIVPHHQQQH